MQDQAGTNMSFFINIYLKPINYYELLGNYQALHFSYKMASYCIYGSFIKYNFFFLKTTD